MSDRVPMRLCVACRVSKEKSQLIRIAKVNGKPVIDKKNMLPGRGLYICPNEECIRKAEKRKALGRAFENCECAGVFEELMEVIK